MPNIPGMESINWWAAVGGMTYWLGIILISILILAAMGAVYYFLSFPYKVTIFPLYGSGRDGIFSIGKPKSNRVRWGNKDKNYWRSMFPLFNKKEIKPFDSEFIYQGRNLFAFEFNNQWFPARINAESEDKVRGEIKMIPHEVLNWLSLQYKKNAQEYSNQDWWSENKNMVYALIAVACCCVLCGVTVYFTYKFAGAGRGDIQGLTNAIQNFATLKGVGPS
jgi:hypothetical protein